MTPERKFDRKKRNSETRKQKPKILIVAEGENVTESQYFRSFQKQKSKCNIHIIIAKHITDPSGMLKAVRKKWKEMDLDSRKGDKAYVVLDLDCDDDKASVIKELAKKTKEVQFIVSNPCFEIWFLLHYRYSTKAFYSGDAVIKELKKMIPDYEKTLDVSSRLSKLTHKAIENSDNLRRYYDELEYEWPSASCNPRTDVDIVIKTITKELD